MIDKESVDRLTHRTIQKFTSLEISEDRKSVAVFYSSNSCELDAIKIAEFGIELVWDMIKEALTVVSADPAEEPGLLRRKIEAITIEYLNHGGLNALRL